MRIAFYPPMKSPDHPTPSGDRLIARQFMKVFELAGHDVELMSRFSSYDKGDETRQVRLKKIGCYLATRIVRRLKSLPNDQRPDVWFTYHLYHKAPDWIGPVVSKELNIPYIVAEASHAPKQKNGKWQVGYEGALEALRSADAVVELNKNDRQCVVPQLKDGAVNHNVKPFLDLSAFNECSDHNNTDPVIICTAMMRVGNKYESFEVLAKALELVKGLPWSLKIIGDGAARADVEELFKPFKDRVTFFGRLEGEEYRAQHATGDLFVWPAVREPFGMTFLEAQACGLPVVAGDAGGVSGVVYGKLVEPENVDVFAFALRDMLINPALRKEMGLKAREHVLNEHSLQAAAQQIDGILKQTVAHG